MDLISGARRCIWKSLSGQRSSGINQNTQRRPPLFPWLGLSVGLWLSIDRDFDISPLILPHCCRPVPTKSADAAGQRKLASIVMKIGKNAVPANSTFPSCQAVQTVCLLSVIGDSTDRLCKKWHHLVVTSFPVRKFQCKTAQFRFPANPHPDCLESQSANSSKQYQKRSATKHNIEK